MGDGSSYLWCCAFSLSNHPKYGFWGDDITQLLNNDIGNKNEYIINLASNEYYKSILTKKLNNSVLTPSFKEFKNGSYKTIAIYAKKARGLMSRFIIEN